MKRVRSMRTKITIITALTLLLCVGASASDPKTHDVNNIDWKKAEVNYTAALNSANFGVRNSAAGHIGGRQGRRHLRNAHQERVRPDHRCRRRGDRSAAPRRSCYRAP